METIFDIMDKQVEDFFETISDIVRPVQTIEKIKEVSDKLFEIQIEIGACEQRLQQLKAVEESKNFLFYTIEEKSKWYKDWGKKIDKEVAAIARNEQKLNELIK